ncbi:MAG TPA: tyrosine-type recombinase/integrase [Candidatus Kapabacteria bacterium]|nr:tyrosine-type recombinase/integrase [Candidatus Kapabacteria bacterium]
MTDKLSVRPGSEIEISTLMSTATSYAAAARSEATRRAYQSDWTDFEAWMVERGLDPLAAEPEAIVLYLTDRARTLKPQTLRRRLTSIGIMTVMKTGAEGHHRHPAVNEVMKGIRRTHGVAPVQKRALMTRDVRRIVSELPESVQGIRDRAIIVVALAGGFRRSELVGLNVDDVEFVEAGVVIKLRRSKVDQEGRGVDVALKHGSVAETCPVRLLRRWMEVSGADAGQPLFRRVSRAGRCLGRLTGAGLSVIVKRCCAAVALNPDLYGPHSCRSGLATECAANSVPIHEIQRAGRWASVATVARYVRAGSLFDDGNASGRIGL